MKRKYLLFILMCLTTIGAQALSITGNPKICLGYARSYSASDAGGTWSSSNTSVATQNPTVLQSFNGISLGTAVITYTHPTLGIATINVEVVDTPKILGSPMLCSGTSTTFSGLPDGGTWKLPIGSVATVDPSSGVVTTTGITGSPKLTYTQGVHGCYGVLQITNNTTPAVGFRPAPTTQVCIDATVLDTVNISGGTWINGSPTLVSMTASTKAGAKNITGLAVGTAIVSYIGSTGCVGTNTINVTTTPSSITGPTTICVGETTTLACSPAGGTWSISPNPYVTLSSGGAVTGALKGSATITYSTGCGAPASFVITVDAPRSISASGGGSFCDHTTITADFIGDCSDGLCGNIYFQNTTPGGTSTTFGGASQIITLSGTYYFRAQSDHGCWGPESSVSVVINPNPDPITGSTSTGAGGTTTLSDATPGGTWVSANEGIATVNEAGIVTGVNCGSTIISYVLPTGCYVTIPITIVCPVILSVCETAPIIICDTKFTYCPGFTLKVSGAPVGCTYSLPSGLETHVSSQSSSTTGVVVTTTYVFGSSPESGDYTITGCGGSITIHIEKPVGICYPCDGFAPACTGSTPMATPRFKTITSAVLTSSEISTTTPDYYYITNPATTLAVSPASGSVLLMAKGVRLTIAQGDNINISGCHLFSRSEKECRWKGISIDVAIPGTGGSTGQLTINDGTLIEYADEFGVLVNPGTSAGGVLPVSGNILTTSNAVFNFDTIGIRIWNYNNQTTLPFSITNSVFTARDLTCYNYAETTATSHYPYAWPNAPMLKTPTGGNPNNPSYAIDAYTTSFGKGKIGVEIINTGKSVPTGANVSTGNAFTFYPVFIGDSTDADKSNLFDTLQTGLRSVSANVVLYNNIFRRTYRRAGVGDGQYGVRYLNATFAYSGYANTLQLLAGADINTRNKFYNCDYAMFADRLFDFTSHKTWVAGMDQYPTSADTPARFGFKFEDSVVGKHDLTDDTIVNVESAIEKNFSLGNTNCTAQGPITITRNQIVGLTATATNAYANFGIKVYDQRAACSTATGSVNISNNWVEGCINSINTKTLSLNMLIENNTIVLRDNGVFATSQRSGIICDTSRFVSGINKNLIRGDEVSVTYNLPAPGLSQPTGVGWVLNGTRGIYMRRVSNTSTIPTSVSCNNVHDVPIGFKFEGVSDLKWRNNTMEKSSYGMVLQYWASTHGIIGTQGGYCDPSDNKWIGSWGTNQQTYSIGSDPTLSTLYVRNSSSYMPSNNGTMAFATGITGAAYLSPTSLIDNGCTPTEVSCGTAGASRFATSENDGASPKVDNIVKAGQRYIAYPNPGNGDITIAREDGETTDVKIKVINAIGATVYSGTLQLNNGKADLSIPNAAPGIYLVELTDSKGSNIFRISVQK